MSACLCFFYNRKLKWEKILLSFKAFKGWKRVISSLVCSFCLDDEEALNSIMKDLAALGRCYNQNISHKPKSRTLLFKQVSLPLSALSRSNGAD